MRYATKISLVPIALSIVVAFSASCSNTDFSGTGFGGSKKSNNASAQGGQGSLTNEDANGIDIETANLEDVESFGCAKYIFNETKETVFPKYPLYMPFSMLSEDTANNGVTEYSEDSGDVNDGVVCIKGDFNVLKGGKTVFDGVTAYDGKGTPLEAKHDQKVVVIIDSVTAGTKPGCLCEYKFWAANADGSKSEVVTLSNANLPQLSFKAFTAKAGARIQGSQQCKINNTCGSSNLPSKPEFYDSISHYRWEGRKLQPLH